MTGFIIKGLMLSEIIELINSWIKKGESHGKQ